MAQLFTPPFQQTLDANANAISGAKLFFYVSGTTTPAAVYANATLSVPLSSPVTADAAGRFVPIYLDPAIIYRVVVADAGGTSIRDVDPVNQSVVADLADGGGLSLVGFSQGDTGAQKRTALEKAREAPRSPEDYTGGIQGAINAATAAAGTNSHADVQLRSASTYLITTPLTLNTMRASLLGAQTIRTATAGVSPLLTVGSTADSDLGGIASSYGYKGRIADNIRLVGMGASSGQVGIDFSSLVANASAQADVRGLVVADLGTGVRFSNRGYNNTFYRLEAFGCDVCVDWVAGGTDNDERNTLISPVLYNSNVALRNSNPSAALQVLGGSIDYTAQVAKVTGGKLFLTDVHMESKDWGYYAFDVQGDGGLISIKGGVLLNQAVAQPTPYLVYVGTGARMDIDGTFIHNPRLTRETPDTPTAFYNGGGIGLIRNTHGFDGGMLPDRLNATSTGLLDPSFESPDWQDLTWIAADDAAITDRHAGSNVSLSKVEPGRRSGEKALRIGKANGGGSPAAVGVIRLPVRQGRADKVLAGLHYRNAASSGTLAFSVQWRWARFDRYDANGLPIWVASADCYAGYNGGLGEPLTATSSYQMLSFCKVPGQDALRAGLAARIAPQWATDFLGIVRCHDMAAGALLIDDMWADLW